MKKRLIVGIVSFVIMLATPLNLWCPSFSFFKSSGSSSDQLSAKQASIQQVPQASVKQLPTYQSQLSQTSQEPVNNQNKVLQLFTKTPSQEDIAKKTIKNNETMLADLKKQQAALKEEQDSIEKNTDYSDLDKHLKDIDDINVKLYSVTRDIEKLEQDNQTLKQALSGQPQANVSGFVRISEEPKIPTGPGPMQLAELSVVDKKFVGETIIPQSDKVEEVQPVKEVEQQDASLQTKPEFSDAGGIAIKPQVPESEIANINIARGGGSESLNKDISTNEKSDLIVKNKEAQLRLINQEPEGVTLPSGTSALDRTVSVAGLAKLNNTAGAVERKIAEDDGGGQPAASKVVQQESAAPPKLSQKAREANEQARKKDSPEQYKALTFLKDLQKQAQSPAEKNALEKDIEKLRDQSDGIAYAKAEVINQQKQESDQIEKLLGSRYAQEYRKLTVQNNDFTTGVGYLKMQQEGLTIRLNPVETQFKNSTDPNYFRKVADNQKEMRLLVNVSYERAASNLSSTNKGSFDKVQKDIKNNERQQDSLLRQLADAAEKNDGQKMDALKIAVVQNIKEQKELSDQRDRVIQNASKMQQLTSPFSRLTQLVGGRSDERDREKKIADDINSLYPLMNAPERKLISTKLMELRSEPDSSKRLVGLARIQDQIDSEKARVEQVQSLKNRIASSEGQASVAGYEQQRQQFQAEAAKKEADEKEAAKKEAAAKLLAEQASVNDRAPVMPTRIPPLPPTDQPTPISKEGVSGSVARLPDDDSPLPLDPLRQSIGPDLTLKTEEDVPARTETDVKMTKDITDGAAPQISQSLQRLGGGGIGGPLVR